MDRKELRKCILGVSEGIFSGIVDILLWEIAYLAEASTTFSRNTWKASVKADRFLEGVNYETIKNALARARKKGYIKSVHHKKAWPEITQEGKRRLEELIPHYDSRRSWDGRLYLITYDIPEEKKKLRELLREYLRRIGCGLVQDSVWLTPYNPREVLKNFITEHNLSGNILISDIGADGSIGDEDLKTLVARIYRLSDLNKKYEEFINHYESREIIDKLQANFAYLSILREDPQLPFAILPGDWAGDKAYQIYKQNFL